ncbi:hypothetical protein [Tateyamaria pelophila]|uniref:hypothetical protein n=1 Tax=Tateyamaria pelophila TaxID=328415 RepID=UPI001CC03C48|nr:hypothetical protein [Tateyamaria pelophila]
MGGLKARSSVIAVETDLSANASHGTFREEEAIHAFDMGDTRTMGSTLLRQLPKNQKN